MIPLLPDCSTCRWVSAENKASSMSAGFLGTLENVEKFFLRGAWCMLWDEGVGVRDRGLCGEDRL